MLRATTLLSRVAIALTLRLHITTVHPGATTPPRTGAIQRRAATTRLRTAITRRRALSLRLRLTLLHAAEVPRHVVTLRPRLAPPEAGVAARIAAAVAADSTAAVVVADPTPAAAEAALTAAVGAAPTVEVVVTNLRTAQIHKVRSVPHGAGLSV